jgi:hypothetical protein
MKNHSRIFNCFLRIALAIVLLTGASVGVLVNSKAAETEPPSKTEKPLTDKKRGSWSAKLRLLRKNVSRLKKRLKKNKKSSKRKKKKRIKRSIQLPSSFWKHLEAAKHLCRK